MEMKCPICGNEDFVKTDEPMMEVEDRCFVCPNCGYIAYIDGAKTVLYRNRYYANEKIDAQLAQYEYLLSLIDEDDELYAPILRDLNHLRKKKEIINIAAERAEHMNNKA